MRVLLLCDDKYHPGHVPTEGTAPLKSKGYEIDVITNGSEFDPQALQNYSAAIMSKSDHVSELDTTGWKTGSIQQAFIDYVENGGGLLVTHSGLVAGEDTQALDMLIGSKFKFHPDQTKVFVEAVKPHPITKNVQPFWETDEHYELEILADDADIIMASYAPAQGSPENSAESPYANAPDKINPCAYVRRQGKGRVCVLTPGHNLQVWLNPNFQQLLDNALNWCAGRS